MYYSYVRCVHLGKDWHFRPYLESLESIWPYFGLSKLLTTRNTCSNFGGFNKNNTVTRSVQLTAVVVVFKVDQRNFLTIC